MIRSDNKKKEEMLASLVKSFPVYEVQQICLESHRYPKRRIRLQRVGLFQTKEGARLCMLTSGMRRSAANSGMKTTTLTAWGTI